MIAMEETAWLYRDDSRASEEVEESLKALDIPYRVIYKDDAIGKVPALEVGAHYYRGLHSVLLFLASCGHPR